MNFISQFNKWACERISQVGGVEIGEVKSKIKELLVWNSVEKNILATLFTDMPIRPVKGHFVQALESAVFRICNKP